MQRYKIFNLCHQINMKIKNRSNYLRIGQIVDMTDNLLIVYC